MKLSKVERKVFGALLILCDDEGYIHATQDHIATTMGYATSGGALSSAIVLLEIKNYIVKVNKGVYKVLL